MNRSTTESKSASGVIASSGANTRLAGAMLVMARAVWVVLVAILASHIYRYRRVSAPLQRQQTKWEFLAVTAVVGLNLAIGVAYFPFPPSKTRILWVT